MAIQDSCIGSLCIFPDEMKNAVSDFLDYLRVELRYSTHTVEAYGRDLRQFISWHTDNDPEAFEAANVTSSDIRHWIGLLSDQDLSATSLRRKLQSLRAYYKWGRQQRIFEANPAADVLLPKKRRKLPNFIKQEEIEDILSESGQDFKSERSHIVLEILYGLGLRQAELLTLKDTDFNASAREIKVTGKRSKQRVIPVPSQLCDEIKRWQLIRDSRYPNLENPRYLISGPHGMMSRNQLYKIVQEALTATSSGRKSPHTLRHSFATSMINNGADLDVVREILGHSSLSSTQIYTHLSIKELMDNYHTSHPRAGV